MRARRAGRLYALEVAFALCIVLLLTFLLLGPRLGFRPASRRSTCAYAMRQLTLSLLQVQEMHRHFPGYANVVGGKRASWIVPILLHLERGNLYQNWHRQDFPADWQSSGFGKSKASFYGRLEILICPSANINAGNAALGDDPLSYIVNSGSARTANDFRPPIKVAYPWVEDLASGVFFNRARADHNTSIPQPAARPLANDFAPQDGPAMTADYIAQHDGLTYTLLLSESLQSGGWVCDPHASGEPIQSEFQMRQNTSFAWFVTGQEDNRLPINGAVSLEKGFDPSLLGINRRKDLRRPLPVNFARERFSNRGGLAAARPSSNHSAGVNTSYCDGHSSYLSEDIDYRVYTQLMTPNGRDVVVDLDASGAPIQAHAPRGTSQRVATPWTYPFQEADFNAR